MPKPTRSVRNNLLRNFRAAVWHECGLSPVDPTAPPSEQVEMAVAAERLRTTNRTAAEMLDVWLESHTGRRPRSDDQRIRSALTGDLSEIFTDAIGASILRGYNESLGSTIGWTSREVLNQQRVERIRLSAPPHLEPVERGSQAESGGQQTAVSESYRIGRFGKYHEIDEQELLDDWLGVLTMIPIQFGQAAARLAIDLAFSELLANPEMADGENLFSAAHDNLGSGALDGTKLDEAVAKLLEQREGGIELNLHAKYLLVPPGLVGTARKLARERKNDDEDDLIVVSDRRLKEVRDPSTGETVTGSDTSWYLAAGENDAAIELGFFDRTTPLIGSGMLHQGKWGVWFDVKLRAAAKAVRPRSIVRYDV